jgi:hypothetical protein
VNIPGRTLYDEVDGALSDPRRVTLIVPEGLSIQPIETEENSSAEDGRQEKTKSERRES